VLSDRGLARAVRGIGAGALGLLLARIQHGGRGTRVSGAAPRAIRASGLSDGNVDGGWAGKEPQ